MKMSPAQLATQLLCGQVLPMSCYKTIDKRIAEGRRMLIQITGKDFGFALQECHDFLKHTGDGGYIWRRNITLPAIMQEALNSKDWIEATTRLSKTFTYKEALEKEPTGAEKKRIQKMQRVVSNASSTPERQPESLKRRKSSPYD